MSFRIKSGLSNLASAIRRRISRTSIKARLEKRANDIAARFERETDETRFRGVRTGGGLELVGTDQPTLREPAP
ncbi:hypothetical protein ACFQ14_05555 [Pseudahrensia aquimaris]|uniref:Uncharacterized protein n=1 Tax=Pseudahrensia aquimaris TaxID=744461 RepID=A0ABW3FHK9_9HYPH